MRPYQTIILLLLVALVLIYFLTRSEPVDPDVDHFVDCYVELAVEHQLGDTVDTIYTPQRDSVLSSFGFTEESFRAVKARLDQQPNKLVDVWMKIDERLRARKDSAESKE